MTTTNKFFTKSWADMADEEENEELYAPSAAPSVDFSALTFEDFKERVSLFNREGHLELYHYNSCDNNTPEFYKRFRGLVFERKNLLPDPPVNENGEPDYTEHLRSLFDFYQGSDNESLTLVGQSYGYTHEYSVQDEKDLNSLLPQLLDRITVRKAFEGTVIRVFYSDVNDSWRFATHRKIDAYRSKWSGPSFGHIFEECVFEECKRDNGMAERFQDLKVDGEYTEEKGSQLLQTLTQHLDKNRCYVFLASDHPKNRIVCRGTPVLYHIQTLERDAANPREMAEVEEDLGLKVPDLVDVKNVPGLVKAVNDLDPMVNQGMIVFLPGRIFKVVNPDYHRLAGVRGNQASLRFRYLQLRKEGGDTLQTFKELYPENKGVFLDVEEDIEKLAWYLHKLYLYRYVSKQYLVLPKEEFHLLDDKCHRWHQENRYRNKVYVDNVKQFLNESEPTYLNRMLRRLRYRYFNKLFEKLNLYAEEANSHQT